MLAIPPGKLTLKDKYLHYNGYIPYNGQKRLWQTLRSIAGTSSETIHHTDLLIE